MPTRFTLTIAKIALGLSRGLGRGGGTALPGLIAERLQPSLLRELATQLPHGVILVTGTNGKTTTTKLLFEMLEANGEKVLSNKAGSNLRRGIFSTLIQATDRGGHLAATIGLFEIDEANLPLVAADLNPSIILVLNLFRDQLDRYGELDTLAAVIGRGIAATTAKLILNADDPLVASLAKYATDPAEVGYFGIEGLPSSGSSALQTAIDSDRCPVCGSELEFERVFYGHIGHYNCPKSDFRRPQPDMVITNAEEATLSMQKFTVSLNGKRSQVELPLPGTYNLYNALAAMAVGADYGIAMTKIIGVVARTKAAFGRVEEVKLGSKTIYLLLIKNPAGFTQIVETFLCNSLEAPVVFAINDNAADGRDVSWLWDVPLEALEPTRIVAITAGTRGSDMALRLKYAGIESESESDCRLAIERLLAVTPEGGTAYILPTYTAMLEIRALLAKETTLEDVWK